MGLKINLSAFLLSVFTVLCLSTVSYAQEYDNGLGIRLGDPFGISYKKYRSDTRALEFILGTSGGNWYTNYYKNAFNRLRLADDNLYDGHRLDFTIAFTARYLTQKEFPQKLDGFKYYYGVGLATRFSQLEYRYFRKADLIDFQNAQRYFSSHNNIDIGPEGIIGLEYTLYDAPVTIYMETSLFGEVLDNPFRFRFYGALGLRINWRNQN